MRATEFIHYLNSDTDDKHEYTHLDLCDEDGKINKKYKKYKEKYKKRGYREKV